MISGLERASQLYHLHQYDLALQEADAVLSVDPQDGRAYSIKALAFLGKKQEKEALENAAEAIALEPEDDYPHYVLSLIHLNLTTDYKKAEGSIREALRINPEAPDYYDILARLKLVSREYAEALRLCDRGLALDPQNVDCLSTRARVLTKMGRKEEAQRDLGTALRYDPENAQTLADAGWIRLEAGDQEGALVAFRDALKLEPGSDCAREGMVEALKAKNFLFRQYLKYAFWVNRLGKGARITFVLGLFLLIRLVRSAPLGGIKWALIGLYVLFVMSAWLINPLHNLFLRFDRFGKYALTGVETIAANLVAGCILVAIGLAAFNLFGGPPFLFAGALAIFFMVIPVSGTASFYFDKRAAYRQARVFTAILMALLAVGFITFPFSQTAALAFFAGVILGEISFSWVATLMRL